MLICSWINKILGQNGLPNPWSARQCPVVTEIAKTLKSSSVQLQNSCMNYATAAEPKKIYDAVTVVNNISFHRYDYQLVMFIRT